MNYLFFIFLPFLIFNTTIFAQTQTHPDSSEYILKVEQHTYSIRYVVNSNIIAMDIDPESKSLLIGLENTHDSQFIIDLEHELINAQNNDFVVLVDGQEVDYKIISNSNSSTFKFFVPVSSEEVEIIGTHVIPEFPFSIIFGLIIMISLIIVFTKVKTRFFKL